MSLANHCIVIDCKRDILNQTRSLCSMHYQRLGRHGSLENLRPRDRVCSVKNCGNKHTGRGLCNTHYSHLYTTPEYKTWINIKTRCYTKTDKGYALYGGRGIRVADEWLHDFNAFHDYMGDRPSNKHSIDRIDSDGDYAPGNVRWANSHQQNANLRSNVENVGVTKHNGRWIARLMIDGKNVLSKYFQDYETAVKARKEAEIKYGIYL